MNVIADIRRRLQGGIRFPSLRCMCLHRLAHSLAIETQGVGEESEGSERLSLGLERLPLEVREEVVRLSETSHCNRVRVAYGWGDVWFPASDVSQDQALRWVIVSGHIGAIEEIRRREYSGICVSFHLALMEYAVPYRHEHLITHYLPPHHPKNREVVQWYKYDDDWNCIFAPDQALGFVLIAIVRDEAQVLASEPLIARANKATLESLISATISYRALECLRVLLPFFPTANAFINTITDEALKNDDLELFSLLHERYFSGDGFPFLAVRYKAERIFFHYVTERGSQEYRSIINELLIRTRSPRILEWIFRTFPYDVDYTLLLLRPTSGNSHRIQVLQETIAYSQEGNNGKKENTN